jgi:DNA-binding NtrC family response regulator
MDSFRVLIVDDEIEFAQVLVKRLRRRKVTASGVPSGEIALAHLTEQTVDVVLLDVRMPEMDGIETLRTIKSRHPLVEVILLTGHASLTVAREGIGLGAFDYLLKPINIDDLLHKLQDAYEKKKIQEKNIQNLKEVIESSNGSEK